MTPKKNLQERERELQTLLATPAGREELQELASRYYAASGKLKRRRGWKQHLLESKEPKRRARLRKAKLIDKADVARLKVLVPYL